MTTDTQQPAVAVIGGGISGLTTAFLLRKKGLEVTVFEKKGYPGGVIKSIRNQGWLVEWGPNTIMAKSEQLWELIKELDLTEHVVETGKEAAKRYIVKNGRPEPLPTSVGGFLRTPLLSLKGKLRIFREPFIPKSRQPESIADFFERRLGREVRDYAVNPFVAGIYAGDPRQLSIRHTLSRVYELEQQFGSIFKGAVKSSRRSKSNSSVRRPGLISFKRGLQELPNQLVKQLDSSIRFGSAATAVTRKDRTWAVTVNDEETHAFDSIIFTAPLHQLDALTFDVEKPGLIDHLESLRYAPIATVSLGFKREQVSHPLDGFGMLVPDAEPFNILGCLFSSSLFGNRAPEEHVLLTCFIGGERHPGHVDLPNPKIKEMVTDDLGQLLGCTGQPQFESLHRWNRAIPQYGLDHQSYLDAMDELEECNRGLYLTGNFRYEVSVPGCISGAYETADRAASFLQSNT
ncbi:protoporphyrinogen oxidase [Halalkalibaculum sp. DA384]|uniref:protoporphyrinogen oxidase n=1 Tax=Halalkalibaculum sp. DA384 TaxID=3373606 RepID=UPI0037541707